MFSVVPNDRTGPGKDIRVRPVLETEFSRWDTCIDAADAGSVYHTARYLDLYSRVAGGQFRLLVVERGDQWLGGLALHERRGRWSSTAGNRLLLQYNGIVPFADPSTYPSERTARIVALQVALVGWLQNYKIDHIHWLGRAPLSDWRTFIQGGWTARPHWTYVIPITHLDDQFNRVERNLRRLIKRCEQSDYRFANELDFGGFHQLHVRTRERKGARQYLPPPALKRWHELAASAGLLTQYNVRSPNGQLAATQLVLHSNHPVTHTVMAAADGELQKTGANAMLRWRACVDLSARGFQGNDLTDADLNPVTHFKSQLGGNLEVNWLISRRDSRRHRWQTALRRLLRR